MYRHLIVLLSAFFPSWTWKIGEVRGYCIWTGFVVLFRHCLRNMLWAVWDCVGKVRANHLSSVALSLWHPADTTL